MPSDAASALAFLDSLAPSGVHLGLDRINHALDALGRPEKSYRVVHVAGTNGKGSTCAFIASCLATQGYRVGLYTSPHLERVNERFAIRGVPISDEVLGQRVLEILERYPQAAARPTPLTYFEFGTLVAMWHFAREAVEVAVLETGLGGRLDATNTASSAVTAVTPISFDHMNYLGNTLGEIAGEKAGIFKPGVPVVLSRQPDEALGVFERVALDVGVSRVWREGRDFSLEGTTYRSPVRSVTDVRPGLLGAHQFQNAAVAMACIDSLGLEVSDHSLRAGIAAARWPGRLEQFGSVVLDGAHNPAGVDTLVAALDSVFVGRRVHLVFGVLEDKDYRPMMQRLFPHCASAHLCPVDSPRTLLPERYVADARRLCPRVEMYSDAAQALAGAQASATGTDIVLGAGSLFLVGQLRSVLKAR